MPAYPYADCDAKRDPAMPFEWEELSSLADLVVKRPVASESYRLAAELLADARSRLRPEPWLGPVWVETQRSDFEPLLPSEPLRETKVGGLDAREIIEPEVFRVFFGAVAR